MQSSLPGLASAMLFPVLFRYNPHYTQPWGMSRDVQIHSRIQYKSQQVQVHVMFRTYCSVYRLHHWPRLISLYLWAKHITYYIEVLTSSHSASYVILSIMIYMLGGASRSGKTLLARKAVSEKKIPYFPLDAMFSGLVDGAPQLDIRYEQSFIDRAERIWPITKPTLNFFLKEEDDFLIEGDCILPKQVDEIRKQHTDIKSCFVGYAELQNEEKLSLIRKYHQGNTDWTKDILDDELILLIDQMIEFSIYLKEECLKYHIPYFDISHDFEKPRLEAFEYLFGN